MNKKDLISTALAGAFAATLVAGGTAWAVASDAGPVNARPTSPAAAASGAPSFADIVARVAPAVVSIDVEGKARGHAMVLSRGGPDAGPGDDGNDDPADPFGALRRLFPQLPDNVAPQPMKATGSGFFISADGYIVTNNHVVEDADKITVRTNDQRTLDAKVVGRDPATDLAVIKVQGAGFPFVSFEDRAQPRVGDWVVAVGNPFNLGGTATAGIVSALNRANVSGSSYVDYMQIDAPINRGNSGGPTFDLYGRVVGVNTAIFTPSGGSVGIGFDIPAEVAARVSRELIDHGKITRGYIGATVQEVTPEIAESLGVVARKGALVAEVTPDGPSQRAGLHPGDLILGVDGRSVDSSADLTRQVALAHPGQDIRLQVRRQGRELSLVVRCGERPSETVLASNDGRSGAGGSPSGGLGLAVAPNPAGGVRVEGVTPGSGAAERGIRPGDVIERAGTHRVGAPADVVAAVTEARQSGRKSVLLLVSRDGRRIFLPVTIDKTGQG